MQRKATKAKLCMACKKEFMPRNSMQKACSVDCAIQLTRDKEQKRVDREHKQRKREYRKNDKKIQREAAQRAFNAYIRERDKGELCISCNRPTDGGRVKVNAGHFKSVGARPDLRFNELNTNVQCEHCNSFRSGNVSEYRKGLAKKIGEDAVRMLESDNQPPKRYTAEDYRVIAKHYRQKLKVLKNDLL